MLVPVCYFSIWFLTAARNTDSAFAICNDTTVLSVNLFILLQDSFVAFCSCWFHAVGFTTLTFNAAMNTDSAFALCSYTTVSCVILFMLVQDSFVTFCLCWFCVTLVFGF